MRAVTRAALTLAALAGVAGCWAKFPEDRFGKHPDSAVIDLAFYEPRPLPDLPDAGVAPEASAVPDRRISDRGAGDLLKCMPNGQLSCTSDSSGIIKCSPSGWGTVIVSCAPFKCSDVLRRCGGCNPAALPSCDATGKKVLSCSLDGLPLETPCPTGCQSGACL